MVLFLVTAREISYTVMFGSRVAVKHTLICIPVWFSSLYGLSTRPMYRPCGSSSLVVIAARGLSPLRTVEIIRGCHPYDRFFKSVTYLGTKMEPNKNLKLSRRWDYISFQITAFTDHLEADRCQSLHRGGSRVWANTPFGYTNALAGFVGNLV